MSTLGKLPQHVNDELTRLRARIAQLERASSTQGHPDEREEEALNRYGALFDSVPVAIWEEDVSCLKAELDRLRLQGISDFRGFLSEHPEFVSIAAGMISVTNVNQAAVSLYGARNKDDLVKSNIRILMPESEQAFREELVAIFESKDRFRAEASIHTVDGRRVDVLVDMRIPRDADRFRHMLLIIVDISDRVRAEQALKKSEELFRTIFQAAQDCVFLKDKELRFTHVNPAMERLLDRPASEIRGRRAEDFFGAEAGDHIRKVDLRVLAGESVEEEHTRPVNGFPITFHDVRVPLRDTEGAIIGICGISRNITERRTVRSTRRAARVEYPSASIRTALAEAHRAAQTDTTLLLLGESGSGKDYFARWIHDHSKRSAGPFFAVNCAAIPSDLAESELFGHEPGAFTGARARRKGLLELAEGGTLLLNEIGELSLPLQSKLLSFLDTRSFLRVGGEKNISVNARIIAATHRDLYSEVLHDRFLKPLWYRLDVLSIRVPPLRERRDDIPFLTRELLTQLSTDLNIPDEPRVGDHVIKKLQAYHWPGNVRELRNVIERALMISEGAELQVSLPHLSPHQEEWSLTVSARNGWDLATQTEAVTRSLCVEALRNFKGNRTETARALGISRTALYRVMKRFNLLRESETDDASPARSRNKKD